MYRLASSNRNSAPGPRYTVSKPLSRVRETMRWAVVYFRRYSNPTLISVGGVKTILPLSVEKQLPLLKSPSIASPSASTLWGVAVSTMLPTVLATALGLAETRPSSFAAAVAGASRRAEKPMRPAAAVVSREE